MTRKIWVEEIPIVNSSSREILVAIEPEGETHGVLAGQVLKIIPKPERGRAERVEFAIEIRDDFISILLMSEKEVFLGAS